MLNSTTERRLTALVVLLPALFLGLNMENAEAQNIEGFPYETLRSPAMGLRGSCHQPTPRCERRTRHPEEGR